MFPRRDTDSLNPDFWLMADREIASGPTRPGAFWDSGFVFRHALAQVGHPTQPRAARDAWPTAGLLTKLAEGSGGRATWDSQCAAQWAFRAQALAARS